MKEPILSIYIPTYNHENYIGRALDSVLMQETDYEYEILVGEDLSTDSTREILKQYEMKYPGKFQFFYREHNMNREKIRNAGDLKRRCRGKYIIGLEGDDYWVDPKKIDKQIRFLEEHPDYIAVAHNCVVVDENSVPNGEEYPECKDEEYSVKHFFSEILPGQLTTIMYKNYWKYDICDTSILRKGIKPGDRVQDFMLIVNGKLHCIQERMSAYRHVTQGGSSFSASAENKYSFVKDERLFFEFVEYAKNNKKNEAMYLSEFKYVKNVCKGVKLKQIKLSMAPKYFKKVRHWGGILKIAVQYIYNYRILKKNVWFN